VRTSPPTPFDVVPAGYLETGELCDAGVPCRVLRPAGTCTPEDFLRVETLDGFLPFVHRDERVTRLRDVA
jgi:hypothetical protein